MDYKCSFVSVDDHKKYWDTEHYISLIKRKLCFETSNNMAIYLYQHSSHCYLLVENQKGDEKIYLHSMFDCFNHLSFLVRYLSRSRFGECRLEAIELVVLQSDFL
jgi:hypothetical protein